MDNPLNYPSIRLSPLAKWLVNRLKLSRLSMIEQYPYKLAEIVQGKEIYVKFSVWDKETNTLILRRLHRLEGKSRKEKIQDAERKVKEINRLLIAGFTLGEKEEKTVLHPRLLGPAIKEAAEIKLSLTGKQNGRSIKGIKARFLEHLTGEKLDSLPLSQVSKKHIYHFLDQIKRVRNLSNRTRNNYKESLSQIFEIMVQREWIETNPCAGVASLRTASVKHVAYTSEQRQTLESYLLKHNYPLYLFTRMIYHGFLRPVEVTRLRIQDVDLDRGIILVPVEAAKNAKQMPVVITAGLRKDLTEFLERFRGDLPGRAFLFSKGFKPGLTHYHRNRFSEAHRAALEETGLYGSGVSGYSWKHTGVTNAYLSGVDIVSIQKQCRHHSLSETETYLRSLGLRFARDLTRASW